MRKPRRWNATLLAVLTVAVGSGALMSCTLSPGPNSMPVVSVSDVVVWAGTHSGPVTVESDCVIVPVVDAAVGVVVTVGVVVVPLVVVPAAVVVPVALVVPVAFVVPVVSSRPSLFFVPFVIYAAYRSRIMFNARSQTAQNQLTFRVNMMQSTCGR